MKALRSIGRYQDTGRPISAWLYQIAMNAVADRYRSSRLLEDIARTFAEHGANIVGYGGGVEDQLAKNWYTAEVGDVKALRGLLSSLRQIDAVFDAFRVTPS